jgi:hypothetical protein
MKSPSQEQNTSTKPTTLRNSILQAALSNSNVSNTSVVPASTMTNATIASPESEAAQRKRLCMIIDYAIALIDSDGFESSMAQPQPQPPK